MKLTFVPNHFKTQEMCERAAKRFSYTFLYISDQYKIQQVCEKVVLKSP